MIGVSLPATTPVAPPVSAAAAPQGTASAPPGNIFFAALLEQFADSIPNDEAQSGPATASAPATSDPAKGRPEEHKAARAIARTSIPDSKSQAKGAKQPDAFPAIPVPTPQLPIPVALKKTEKGGEDHESAPAQGSQQPKNSAPDTAAIHTDVALQIRLKVEHAQEPAPPKPEPHRTEQAKPSVAPRTETSSDQPDPERTPDRRSTDRQPTDHQAQEHQSTPGVEPAVNAAVPVNHAVEHSAPQVAAPAVAHSQSAAPAPRTPVPVSAPPTVAHIEDSLPEQKVAAQPVRSLSLEFTPDGAGDVKLRLSERAGEVHITVHSNDSALSGRLHEGVHDLVGSLSSAGYDAEAWTANQDRQNPQRPPDEEAKAKRNPQSSAGDDEFAGMFQQSTQENA